MAAVIGGLGNIPGAIAGGFFLGVLESVTGGQISSGYRDAITYRVADFGSVAAAFWPVYPQEQAEGVRAGGMNKIANDAGRCRGY